MGFDLDKVRQEQQASPLASPYPLDLSIAVVNDTLRMAAALPVPKKTWDAWTKKAHPLWAEQVGMLAYLLSVTSLREQTVATLKPDFPGAPAFSRFFLETEPLTAEMIRANAFRQEEFLRKWVDCVGGTVAGEGPAQSKKKLEQLDYRKALSEYSRAEIARKAEAERRAKLLAEAAAREAEARGWRE